MKRYRGFSLVELMIVLAIVAIISALAVPTYNQYVIQGQRAEGRAFALNIASLQENFFQQHGRYTANVHGSAGLHLGSVNSENGLYQASVRLQSSRTRFTVTVTPTFADADCGYLTLDNTGAKASEHSGSECW